MLYFNKSLLNYNKKQRITNNLTCYYDVMGSCRFFCVYKGVSRRLLQSSDKWQKVAKKLTFGAVLLNNLTKNHAKLGALFLYFPLR